MEPVVPMTVAEIITEAVELITTLGLMPFVTVGAIVGAATLLFRRVKSAAR